MAAAAVDKGGSDAAEAGLSPLSLSGGTRVWLALQSGSGAALPWPPPPLAWLLSCGSIRGWTGAAAGSLRGALLDGCECCTCCSSGALRSCHAGFAVSARVEAARGWLGVLPRGALLLCRLKERLRSATHGALSRLSVHVGEEKAHALCLTH